MSAVKRWTKKTARVEEPAPEPEPGLSAYQRAMCDRLLVAPVVSPPEPWRRVFDHAYGRPVAGSRVRIAGLFGGGLHTTTGDGWTLGVVAPAWPHERVLLSRDGGLPHAGPHGGQWWHIYHAHYSELRAAGFSPSGETVAVATSSDLALWTRRAE